MISRPPPSATPSTLIIGSIHYPVRKFQTQQWYNLARYLSPVYAKPVNQKIIYPTYLFVDYTALNGKQKRLAKYPIQNQPSKHAEVIFIGQHLPVIAQIAKKYLQNTGKKSDLFLTINRSSCGNCASRLAEQQNQLRQYLQVHICFAAPFAKANEFVNESNELKLIPQAHQRIVQEIAILLSASIKVSATEVWPIINQNYRHPTSLGGQKIALRNVLTEQLIASLIEEANQLVSDAKDDKI